MMCPNHWKSDKFIVRIKNKKIKKNSVSRVRFALYALRNVEVCDVAPTLERDDLFVSLSLEAESLLLNLYVIAHLHVTFFPIHSFYPNYKAFKIKYVLLSNSAFSLFPSYSNKYIIYEK
jgi:hypothetical protein